MILRLSAYLTRQNDGRPYLVARLRAGAILCRLDRRHPQWDRVTKEWRATYEQLKLRTRLKVVDGVKQAHITCTIGERSIRPYNLSRACTWSRACLPPPRPVNPT